MAKILQMIDGHKTHLAAVIAGCLLVAKAFGYLDEQQFLSIMGIDAAFFGFAIRDAIRKLEK